MSILKTVLLILIFLHCCIFFSLPSYGHISVQATRSVSPNGPQNQDADGLNLDTPFIDPEDAPTTGHVVEASDDLDTSARGTELWKLNVALALIACWIACMLTGWGTIQGIVGQDDEQHHTAANPTVSRVNMAMVGVSQWSALILYSWTLVAPRLFPDRDFS